MLKFKHVKGIRMLGCLIPFWAKFVECVRPS
jgi:hypothetical protein